MLKPIRTTPTGYDIIGLIKAVNNAVWVIVAYGEGQFVTAFMNNHDDETWYWGKYWLLAADEPAPGDLDAFQEMAFQDAYRRAGYTL